MRYFTLIEARDLRVGDVIPPNGYIVLSVDDDFMSHIDLDDGYVVGVWTTEERYDGDDFTIDHNYSSPDFELPKTMKLIVERKL